MKSTWKMIVLMGAIQLMSLGCNQSNPGKPAPPPNVNLPKRTSTFSGSVKVNGQLPNPPNGISFLLVEVAKWDEFVTGAYVPFVNGYVKPDGTFKLGGNPNGYDKVPAGDYVALFGWIPAVLDKMEEPPTSRPTTGSAARHAKDLPDEVFKFNAKYHRPGAPPEECKVTIQDNKDNTKDFDLKVE